MTEVPATNATTLSYADLVREGKRAVAAIDAAWWGLAQLATNSTPSIAATHSKSSPTTPGPWLVPWCAA